MLTSHTPGTQRSPTTRYDWAGKRRFTRKIWRAWNQIRAGVRSNLLQKLLKAEEFTSETSELIYFNGTREKGSIAVPANSIAFTLCHTPVIYELKPDLRQPEIEVVVSGKTYKSSGAILNEEMTRAVLARTSEVERIKVCFANTVAL